MTDQRPRNLYELAHQALVAIEEAGHAITDAAERQEQREADVEPIDPWLLYVLCDELATCLEQLSFPVEALGARAAGLADAWEQEAFTLLERGEERPMVLQLERAADQLRRAAALATGAAVAAMQPGLQALVEDLEVRLRIPESDPPRWVDVLQGWGETGYRVRDARGDGPPLHLRPVERVDKPAHLAATIAEVAGISLETVQSEKIAVDLAHEAVRRLEAMATQRDRANRHSPSGRLPEDPEPERAPWRPGTPDVLAAAIEDLTDREGRRHTQPLGLGLAMALADVADSHPPTRSPGCWPIPTRSHAPASSSARSPSWGARRSTNRRTSHD